MSAQVNTVNHSLVKFRPVLTLAQISNICAMAKQFDSPESQSILKVLVPMIAKVEVGAISPAYKLSEIHAAKVSQKHDLDRYNSGAMTPEEEALYESNILGL